MNGSRDRFEFLAVMLHARRFPAETVTNSGVERDVRLDGRKDAEFMRSQESKAYEFHGAKHHGIDKRKFDHHCFRFPGVEAISLAGE